MKKSLIIAILLAGVGTLSAQTVVTGRQQNHYYSRWFDTCYYYFTNTAATPYPCSGCFIYLNMWDAIASGSGRMQVAAPDYTDKPLAVKGIAIMQGIDSFSSQNCVIDTFDEEYVSIGYYDSATNTMNILATARWDTIANPNLWKLQMIADTTQYVDQVTQPIGYRTCYLYEAYFDHPVTVDSVFYMIGTKNGNRDSVNKDGRHCSAHRKVLYQTVTTGRVDNRYNNTCVPDSFPSYYFNQWNGWEESTPASIFGYGPFIPIVDKDNVLLTVHSADSTMGYGSGGPFVEDSSWTEIRAWANYGFRFRCWNDGDTTNPRRVFVTCDTAFTAYFDPIPYHTITVSSSNLSWGYVIGGGTYPESEGAPIRAYTYGGYEFVCWSDSVYTPERVVYMTSDTNLVAIFREIQDTTAIASAAPDEGVVFALSPNPTTGSVVLTATDFESHRYDYRRAAVVVLDVAGHEVYRTPLTAPKVTVDGLVPGVYFVTLITPQASATQKLVVR